MGEFAIGFMDSIGSDLDVEPEEVIGAIRSPKEASRAGLLAAYLQDAAIYVEDLIDEPIWEAGSGPAVVSTGFAGWREKRAAKRAGRGLGRQVSAQSFFDASIYTANGMQVAVRAMIESAHQVAFLLDGIDPEQDQGGQTWLEESRSPYRPGGGDFAEEFLLTNYPPPLGLDELFEETAVTYDLPFLAHDEGVARMETRSREFREIATTTPYSIRLTSSTLDDLSLSERLESHTVYSMQPFVDQLHEHIYAIALDDDRSGGIILDGPISRHGGTGRFDAWAVAIAFLDKSKAATQKLVQISRTPSENDRVPEMP